MGAQGRAAAAVAAAGPWRAPTYTQRQRADVSQRGSRRGGPRWIPSRPSACLSVSLDLL